MYLNTLSPSKGAKHAIKRLGRGIGSSLGKTGGRGHKGQKSRSGGNVRRGFKGGQVPLHRCLPKFGFSSRRKKITTEVSLTECDKKITGNIVDFNTLKKAHLIKNKTEHVKIILSGKGKINRTITICCNSNGINNRVISITNGVRNAIESAGGSIKE